LNTGVALENGSRDDTVLDGARDSSTDKDSSKKFEYCCSQDGLLHGKRSRRDRGSERVGDTTCQLDPGRKRYDSLVGTDVVGIESTEDDTKGKEVVPLVEGSD
jgi:hypothetical protein